MSLLGFYLPDHVNRRTIMLMWILKLCIVYLLLPCMHVISWELDGWFIIGWLNIAQELNKAVLTRFFTLIALPSPASPSLQLSSSSSFSLIHWFDLPGSLRSNFILALQITTSIQHVNATTYMSLQGDGHNIMYILLCVSHRVLLFVRMRKVLNRRN